MGYLKHPEGVTRERIVSGCHELEIAMTRLPCGVSLAPLYESATERRKSWACEAWPTPGPAPKPKPVTISQAFPQPLEVPYERRTAGVESIPRITKDRATSHSSQARKA